MRKFFIISGLVIVMSFVSSCAAEQSANVTAEIPPPSVEAQDSVAEQTAVVTSTISSPTQEPIELDVKIGEKLPVSRAMAAKMLTLLLYDYVDLEPQINFEDCTQDDWFFKYVNAAYAYGIMQGVGDNQFLPEQSLTLAQAQTLLDKISPDAPKMQLGENADKPISYALWVSLFTETAAFVSSEIKTDYIIPLASAETNSALKQYQTVTDKGPFTCDGLVIDPYIDKTLKILKKDTEILAFIQVSSVSPTIENSYICESTAQNIKIFSGGAERTYVLAEGVLAPTAGGIASVTISEGKVIAVQSATGVLNGAIKRTDESLKLIELDSGKYEQDANFKVYSIADGAVKWKSITDLTVGKDIADFYQKGTGVCAAVITKKATPETIRVAIQDDSYSGFYHDDAVITSDANFSVMFHGGEEFYLAPGEYFTFTKQMFDSSPRAYIESDGKLIIKGLKRSSGNSAAYRGKLEVCYSGEGFLIVNEVGIEEYLYAVVPSEIPSSYGAEAAKVQAVTARSYAYSQLYANRFHKYGGNVDDSTSCQVYNNIPETQLSISAVDETNGMCLTYNGNVVSATFFSTSAGVTANSGEVWSSSGKFPATTPDYLVSRPQTSEGTSFGNLSDEETMRKFITNNDIKTFDSNSAWSRWNVTMTYDQITESVNTMLASRFAANPRMIKTLTGNAFVSRPITTIGNVIDIEVISRGQGGNIMEIKITGTESTILVRTEYNIRVLLAPSNKKNPIVIKRRDGSTVENYALMPSSFFVIDKTDKGVSFHGGGNGHGAGMSQTGVKGMIDAGYSFEEILSHYYPNTQIQKKI